MDLGLLVVLIILGNVILSTRKRSVILKMVILMKTIRM